MVRINVGDTITAQYGVYYRTGSASYDSVRITRERADALQLRVTRVYEDSVLARGPLYGTSRNVTIRVGRHAIATVNGVDPRTGEVPIPPRPWGTPPEDTDEQTYIHQDDPGIQWLWEDLAAYAKSKSWCADYEALAERMGIPGREQEWVANATLADGTVVSSTINATTQERADEQLRTRLAAHTG